MTVPNSNNRKEHIGNGVTTVFTYDFHVHLATDLKVYLRTGEVETLLSPSSYTVTGITDPDGGTVTYPLSGPPISSLQRLVIYRNLPLTQTEIDLTNQSAFHSEIVEKGFDRGVMMLQQLKEEIDRKFGVDITNPVPPGDLLSGIDASVAAAAASAAEAQGSATLVFPSTISSFLEPRLIKYAHRDVYSIYDFPGGEVERAKATSVADYQEVITRALETGERIHFPAGDYPIRSLGESVNGVSVDADTPIDVRCAFGAKFIAGDVFEGVSGALFRLKAATQPNVLTGATVPFRWDGGEINGEQLTADYGVGGGTGLQGLDLTWYTRAVVSNMRFIAGLTAMSGANIGFGYMDSAIATHGLAGVTVRESFFSGWSDVCIYLSGVRDIATLAANPFATSSGTPTVTVTKTAHGLVIGDLVWFNGATAVAGLTIFGQYAVATVPGANTFTITASGNASSSTSGGGSAVLMTSSRSDSAAWSQAGVEASIIDNTFVRSSVAITAKRNQLQIKAQRNFVFQCLQGISSLEINDPNSWGKGWSISGNYLEQIQGFPITITGGKGDVIEGNRIKNWGKWLSDQTTFTPVSSGNRIGAINVRSCNAPKITNNDIRQEGLWLAGTPGANVEPVGINLRADAAMEFAVGTQRAQVRGNTIDGAWIPIREYSESSTGNNIIENNRATNAGADSVYQPTSFVTLPTIVDFTPVFTGGTFTYEAGPANAGQYRVEKSHVKGHGYIDLASASGLAGVVTITGLPFTNTFAWPIPVTISAQNITRSAGYTELVAQIDNGENFIKLLEVHGTTGAQIALPATNLGANSRIAFSFSYKTAP